MRAILIIVIVLSSIVLVAVLGFIAITALSWGDWNRDGTGPIGFWNLFAEGINATAAPIVSLLAGIVLPAIILSVGKERKADKGN